MKKNYSFKHILLFLFLASLFASCVSPKELTYFQTKEGQEWQKIQAITNSVELKIQIGDYLNIVVSSFDPIAVAPFNRRSGNFDNSQNFNNGNRGFNSYLVNSNGIIEFPVLGDVQADGLLLEELKANLLEKVKEYVKDPVVSVRFDDLRVTVIGEVRNKGTVSVNREKLSIIEALGQAGDITDFGDRSNVLLIREENGKRTMEYIDLLTMDVFNSPYYYLKQNDILYVEPNKRKSVNLSFNETGRAISIVSGLTSLTALLIALFRN